MEHGYRRVDEHPAAARPRTELHEDRVRVGMQNRSEGNGIAELCLYRHISCIVHRASCIVHRSPPWRNCSSCIVYHLPYAFIMHPYITAAPSSCRAASERSVNSRLRFVVLRLAIQPLRLNVLDITKDLVVNAARMQHLDLGFAP